MFSHSDDIKLPIKVTGERGEGVICTIALEPIESGKPVDEVIMYACSLIGGDINPAVLGLKYDNGQILSNNALIGAGEKVRLYSLKGGDIDSFCRVRCKDHYYQAPFDKHEIEYIRKWLIGFPGILTEPESKAVHIVPSNDDECDLYVEFETQFADIEVDIEGPPDISTTITLPTLGRFKHGYVLKEVCKEFSHLNYDDYEIDENEVVNQKITFEKKKPNVYIDLLEEAPDSYTAHLYSDEYTNIPKRTFVFNPAGEESSRVLKRHCTHLNIDFETHLIVDQQGLECEKIIPLGKYFLIHKV